VFRSCRRRHALPQLAGSACLFREPDAGNPPVRFDEREEETEPSQTGLRRRGESPVNRHREATVTAPLLDSTVRRERRWFTAGESPARELFAPPGSNRSGGEGNEAVGASGVEGRVGDLASMQAVT